MPIWVPDGVHEAVRDLVRAREAAARDLRHKRQQVLSFLLRHGRIFTGHRHWSRAHLRWLAGPAFNHPAQQIVFQERRRGLTYRRVRRALVEGAWSYRYSARLTETIRARLANLPKAPVAVAAIAREMAAFLWAIGRVAEPA